jgi:nitroreductase
VWFPPKLRLTSPIKRRSNNTRLPVTKRCGRKAQLGGKFSALCGFGIKPGYRSCQRDLGVLGNYPAVQNMLLAPPALGLGATLTTLYLQFETEAEAALALPPGFHSYALLPIGYPMGRLGPVRRVPLADVVYEDQWGQAYRGF